MSYLGNVNLQIPILSRIGAIDLHTKFYTPILNSLLVTAIKPKNRYRFQAPAMLFYALQNKSQKLHIFRWLAGRSGFDSRQELGIFHFAIQSRTALGPTQPPIQWVPAVLSPGVKRPGCEADHSPPSSVEVKNAWSYTSISPIRFHGMVLS
jgi:hypothetical protein